MAILFENYLWRGNRSTKRSADNFNAFKSNNYPYLAKIGLGIQYDREALARHHHACPLQPRYELDSNVMAIDLFPGLNKRVLDHLLNAPGVKGIVLRTYGAGNGPTWQWFIDSIRRTVERGVVIVNVTQCVNGGVHPNRYVAGDVLAATGVVPGHDLTFEAAITKMMFLFGLNIDAKEVARRMAVPIAGELTLSTPK